MLDACLTALAPQPGETHCDATLGFAGHAIVTARSLLPDGMLIGIDQDEQALAAASARVREELPGLDFRPLKGNFGELDELLLTACVPGIDSVLFDIGTSSWQLDTPARGFSYAQDAPLDFRMDPSKHTPTAAELLHSLDEAQLAWIIRTYGEERWAARIAHFIVRRREKAPIKRTSELVETIRAAIPAGARDKGGHPAKRTFQALRIYVNNELEMLESGLEAAIRWLNPGGRIVVISYHSLEDRIVKETFAAMLRGCVCPPGTPVCVCGKTPVFTSASKKPLVASSEETASNPRSRSAKLRWGIKRLEERRETQV
jgi:16S rRNA (cytosine1402-N4)-methyltransferase